MWTAASGINPSVPSAGFAQFGGITPDELTVAWTTSSATIDVADRASASSAFGAPVTVSTGTTTLAADRVAVGYGGTQLVAVTSDRSKFIEISRMPGGSTWTIGSQADLVNVNALPGNGGGTLYSPVIGADGNTLYLLFALPGQAPSLMTSTWDGSGLVWGIPVTQTSSQLTSADTTHMRRPTGGSSDALTMFFFDEVAGIERAAWRNGPSDQFGYFTDIGAIPEAAPNDKCNRLYFQGTSSGGQGLGEAF